MKTTSISTLSLSRAMQSTVTSSQSQISSLENEAVSGTYDDVGLALGVKTSQSLDYNNESNRLQAIVDSNSVASQRMDSSQLALTQMSSNGQTLLDSLVALTGSSDESTLKVSADQATAVLNSFQSYANSSSNGEYLFSGINTDVQPLADTFVDDVTSDFNTSLDSYMSANGVASASDMTSDQMTAFLSDYTTNFDWSSYTNASDTTMTSRISTSESAQTSTSLNTDGFKNLVLSSVITSQLATAGLSSDALTSVNATTTNLAGQAISGINLQASTLGLSQQSVEDASTALKSQQTIISTQLNDLTGVDTYEASVKLNTLLTQVETSYSITSKISQLSLVNYL
jgi:flagellar hook-associated protein 3 FlgL